MNAYKALLLTFLICVSCVGLHEALKQTDMECIIDTTEVVSDTFVVDSTALSKDTILNTLDTSKMSLKDSIEVDTTIVDTIIIVDNLYKVEDDFYFMKNRNILIEVDPEVIEEYYSD